MHDDESGSTSPIFDPGRGSGYRMYEWSPARPGRAAAGPGTWEGIGRRGPPCGQGGL